MSLRSSSGAYAQKAGFIAELAAIEFTIDDVENDVFTRPRGSQRRRLDEPIACRWRRVTTKALIQVRQAQPAAISI